MTVRAQSGFTLVELLVASAILVVLGAAGYLALDVVLRSAEATTASSQRLEQLQRGFTQMATDLEQLVGRPVRDDLGDEQAALVYDAGLQLLEFTRAGLPNPAGWARSSLQRVSYTVQEGALWRTYWRELDRVQGAQTVRRLLFDAVRGVTFRFLDNQQEWHEQWPPLRQGSFETLPLPRAVEVRVELEDWGEVRRVYATPG